MRATVVRRAQLAAAVVLIGTVTACGAQTVTGQGSAAAGAVVPSGSSGASSSGDFPSGSVSASVPAASTPVRSGSARPDGSGFLVTEPAGHYQLRMPAKPKRSVQPGSVQGYKYTLYLSTVKDPYLALVEGEVVEPALPKDQIGDTLDSAVSSFQRNSEMTLVNQQNTTFNGHTAKTAVLEHAGDRYELLVAAYSGAQIYLFFAPEGSKFDALTSSFRAI
jgi:hypothetical protein